MYVHLELFLSYQSRVSVFFLYNTHSTTYSLDPKPSLPLWTRFSQFYPCLFSLAYCSISKLWSLQYLPYIHLENLVNTDPLKPTLISSSVRQSSGGFLI